MATNTQVAIPNENDWQLNKRSTSASVPDHEPLDHRVPNAERLTDSRPQAVKPLVFALLIVAMLGAIGTIIGFTSGADDPGATSQNESTIATLITERDGLVDEVTELDSTIATLTAERDGLVEQVSSLGSDLDVSAVEYDRLVDRVTELDSTLVTLTAERIGAASRVASLEAGLVAQTELAADAVAGREALAALFPFTFEGSLIVDDLVGTYDADYTKIFCEGFANCTTEPAAVVSLRETPEGYLELVMDGYLTAGLARVDGGLVAVADSTTAVAACGGTPRVARVAATIYPSGLTAGVDGTVQVGDLGATVIVQSAATADCPAGTAIYGARLAPQA
jgi:chorismate mutase